MICLLLSSNVSLLRLTPLLLECLFQNWKTAYFLLVSQLPSKQLLLFKGVSSSECFSHFIYQEGVGTKNVMGNQCVVIESSADVFH